MKKIKNNFNLRNIFITILIIASFGSVSAIDIEDNSIVDQLEKTEKKELNYDFNLKSFESCEGLEKVMGKYIKDYWKNNKKRWGGPIMYKGGPAVDFMQEDSIGVASPMAKSAVSESISEGSSNSVNQEFSKTNSQVDGVDESDIVKTDGEYIYYYNDLDKYVYIVKSGELEVVKKIKIPKTFSRPVLYIGKNRLTIISSGYSDTDYSKRGYWINRNTKTYTIVFDTTNIKKPILSKLYIADGDLRKSRKIGDKIYVVSNNNFSIPYYNFKNIDDIKIDVNKILPKKIDISKVSDKTLQNLKLKGRKLPYNISTGNIAKCNDIEYVLPDEDTINKYDFSPSYNIISVIDTKNTNEAVKTKVIAGSNAELYMSLENIYLTSNMYTSYDFTCGENARCMMPWFSRGTNTLIHKINVDGNSLKYQDSTIVPGNPMTQYSMDEYKGDFRILTQTNNWDNRGNNSHTDLYILDKNLKLKGSLKNLGTGEQFKSSRYIGDKLFLVTFKQVDPLYAIDVSDSSNPKVLGELKIPGYSTYLHPYDDKHLIGLGYDTTENKWGGTVNSGVKVDLYEINYDKKCGDSDLSIAENKMCDKGEYKGIIVKQKFTKTFGGNRSYSEALSNPRMFMWKASDKKLFLPVSLFTNSKEDIYRSIDFFQGLVTMTIDSEKGIKEDYRLTHIDFAGLEDKRTKECSKYSKKGTTNKCVKLISGEEYCEPERRQYIPKYCYADSTIGEYISSKSWNYRNSFIKRALWIGNDVITLGNEEIRSSNINTGKKISNVKIGK